MDLTIVIVSFKSGDILHRCIKSIDKRYPILGIENSIDNKLKLELEEKYQNVNCILPKDLQTINNNVFDSCNDLSYIIVNSSLTSNVPSNIFDNINFLKKNDVINISKGERHRIVGTNTYAIVAEIWIHTFNDNLSDEYDIVRIKDDFGR